MPSDLVIVNRGIPGASAYERAVALEGFSGTEQEWLDSLKADPTLLNEAVAAAQESASLSEGSRVFAEGARDAATSAAQEASGQAGIAAERAAEAAALAVAAQASADAAGGYAVSAQEDSAAAIVARNEAENYASVAGTSAQFYDTIALGRAAVEDGEQFGVRANQADGLLRPTVYRRTSATTEILIAEIVSPGEVADEVAAVLAALAAHIETKGQPGGFAALTGDGHVPFTQLLFSDQETSEDGTASGSVLSPQGATHHYNFRVGEWVRASSLLRSTSALAFLTALGGKQAPAIDAADDQIRALAVLADERAQRAELGTHLQHDQINHIVARLAAAEATIQQLVSEADPQMTTYPLAATVGTEMTVIVPSADVQYFRAFNNSPASVGARVAFGFGAPPADLNGSVDVVEAGGAIEIKGIAGVPIYAISNVDNTPIAGAFSVGRNDANPVWENDFQTLVAGMGPNLTYAWENAYRRFYSALRREGILSQGRGVFSMVAHDALGATQNWTIPGEYMTAVSEPVFMPGVGFLYDGVDDAHDTGRRLNGFTTSLDLAAMVWTGTDDQLTGRVAMGDGATAIQANRSPTQAALNTGTTDANVVSIPYLGAMIGFTRTKHDRATALRPGGQHELVMRDRIMTLPGRNMHFGANNAAGGLGNFYAGVIKGGYFGKALTTRQALAYEVAVAVLIADAAKAMEAV